MPFMLREDQNQRYFSHVILSPWFWSKCRLTWVLTIGSSKSKCEVELWPEIIQSSIILIQWETKAICTDRVNLSFPNSFLSLLKHFNLICVLSVRNYESNWSYRPCLNGLKGRIMLEANCAKYKISNFARNVNCSLLSC